MDSILIVRRFLWITECVDDDLGNTMTCTGRPLEAKAASAERNQKMCTMIVHQAKVEGRGKNGGDWFELREANISYDHPYDLPLEHALNIDFVNEAKGPAARVAVELTIEGARNLVTSIQAVLAQAEERGVLEDIRVAASSR